MDFEEEDNADEALTPEELELLGIESESDLEKRAVFLRMIYTNPRYAPADRDEKWDRIMAIFERKGITPKEKTRKVATYCGNHYLLPGDKLGSLAQCRAKGHRMGDRHGNLNPQQGWP